MYLFWLTLFSKLIVSLNICKHFVHLLVPYLLRTFPRIIQQAPSLHWSLHYFVPAALNAQEQVFNQDHILLLAEVFQMGACLIQLNYLISVWVDLCCKDLSESKLEARWIELGLQRLKGLHELCLQIQQTRKYIISSLYILLYKFFIFQIKQHDKDHMPYVHQSGTRSFLGWGSLERPCWVSALPESAS